jgi:GntR family transcriptional regulator
MLPVLTTGFLAGQSRYGSLAEALRARIAAGEWAPGTSLPSEQTLASQQGVALGTMRRALELLAADGVVERIHGKGTFVRIGMVRMPTLRFFRFGAGTDEIPVSRILSREALPAPADVGTLLGLADGPVPPQVLHLRRLRLLADRPCVLEHIWLPLPLFAPLAEGDPTAWGDLLYPLFSRACGVHVHRAVDDIVFDALSQDNADDLGLPAGHPCAAVHRRTYDLLGHCIEVRTTRGDAHAFRYTTTIT